MSLRALAMTFLIPVLCFAQPPSESKKNFDQARQHYMSQRAVLPPDDVEGHLELGYFCSENGLFREAVQEFQKILNAPDLSLKSKQNVARLIETTQENAAITLYNDAMMAWQQDRNFAAAKQKMNQLFTDYPTAKVMGQARQRILEIEEDEKLKKELEQVENKLKSAKSENCIVFSPDKKLSQALAQQAERKRKEIITRLGFSIFPSWKKNPARIYVFPSREEFTRYAKSPEWSGGWTLQVLGEDADGNKDIVERTVFTFAGVPGLQESVIPHEMAHLVFREFLGFSQNLPTWLDEGVAIWQEDTKHVEIEKIMTLWKLENRAIPFQQFLFLKNYPPEPSLYYAQSYSIVEFLVTSYGSKKFVDFAKALSLQQPLSKALVLAYHDEFLDVDDFEQTWKSWMSRRQK